MTLTATLVGTRLRTLTLALTLVALIGVPTLTTPAGAQEPVNIAAAEQSNTAFVEADALAPFRRLGISPVQAGLLLPAIQSVRGA